MFVVLVMCMFWVRVMWVVLKLFVLVSRIICVGVFFIYSGISVGLM